MPLSRATLVDVVGLRIQDLHASGKLSGDQPLLRIDNLKQAREAPFQFDAARGKLHRAGCRAIPRGSDSALYGVWEIKTEDPALGCPRCNPMETPSEAPSDAHPRAEARPWPEAVPDASARPHGQTRAAEGRQDDHTVDLLYGFLSVVSQFGGVLRERGQEYRRSRAGTALGARVEKIYAEVNEGERRVLDVLTTSLGTLAVALREIEGGLGGDGREGAGRPAAQAPPDDAR